MTKPKYKYHINHYYSLLPRDKDLNWVLEQLVKEKIPHRTFYRDRAIELTDKADIPGSRLMIYAKLFSVEVNQLYNFDPKIKPLNERKVKA